MHFFQGKTNVWKQHLPDKDIFGGGDPWPFKRLSDLQIGDQQVTAWITWFFRFCFVSVDWIQTAALTYGKHDCPKHWQSDLHTSRNKRSMHWICFTYNINKCISVGTHHVDLHLVLHEFNKENVICPYSSLKFLWCRFFSRTKFLMRYRGHSITNLNHALLAGRPSKLP